MSKKRKPKDDQPSVLRSAMSNTPPVIEGVAQQSRWPAVVTVPMALVGIAMLIFGVVKLVRFAWFF